MATAEDTEATDAIRLDGLPGDLISSIFCVSSSPRDLAACAATCRIRQAGHTLAYLTAHHGHADVLKVLYEYGADLAATTRVRGLLHAFNLDVSNRHQMTLWRTVMRFGSFTI